jgi:hypothetical protein
MSIGAGVSMSKLTGDDRGDSFGITGLCSIGPIIAVLTLGIVAKVEGSYVPPIADNVVDTRDGVSRFIHGFGEHSRRYFHLIVALMDAGYIVAANDVGQAKERIALLLDILKAEQEKEQGFKAEDDSRTTIRKAMPFEVDCIVPKEFSDMFHV